ncbi:Arc family DNA binding domain-containing protein [Rufibacter aurantiacus]
MAQKKSFALRMIADMMKALVKWAAGAFRSTNGQIEWIVQSA